MYEELEKSKENKSRAVANSVVHKKSGVKQGFGFVDNRPKAKIQKGIQLMQEKNINQKSVHKNFDVSKGTMQFYKESGKDTKISENELFAVVGEGKTGKLYTKRNAFPFLQHVVLKNGSESKDFNGVTMTNVEALWENEDAMKEMYCGKFSESLTGVVEDEENEKAHTGRSLYVNNLTADGKNGWANHFAPVIVEDETDRGTIETAVGLDYWWFGIYGKKRGQTFRYKTQVANIMRQLSNQWIEKDEGRRLLNILKTRYTLVDIEDIELPVKGDEWIISEIKNIDKVLSEGVGELKSAAVKETPAPKTKTQKDEEIRRMLEEIENKQKWELIKKIVGATTPVILCLLGYYLFAGGKKN